MENLVNEDWVFPKVRGRPVGSTEAVKQIALHVDVDVLERYKDGA